MEISRFVDMEKAKSWRGITTASAACLVTLGCMLAWSQQSPSLVSFNWSTVVLLSSSIANFFAIVSDTPLIFLYTFGAFWYLMPLNIYFVDLSQAAVLSTAHSFIIIGMIASFATYPVVKLEKLQREFTNYVVVGMVSLFSLIGFICGLATSIQMSPYLNLTICGLLTTVVFNVAYLFNLAVELYASLFLLAQVFVMSLGTALLRQDVIIIYPMVGVPPAIIASGVFYFLSSAVMLLAVLHRIQQNTAVDTEAVSVLRATDRLKTWRGMAAVACVLVCFLGAILLWAAQTYAHYAWLAFILTFAAALNAAGILTQRFQFHLLAFGMALIAFPQLAFIPKMSSWFGHHGGLAVAGVVIQFIAFFASFIPVEFKLEEELERKTLITSGAVFTLNVLGSIINGAPLVGVMVSLHELGGRAALIGFLFLGANILKHKELASSAPLAIGMLFAHSLFGAEPGSPAAAVVGAVFIWFAALAMILVSYWKLRTTVTPELDSTREEYQPIAGPNDPSYPVAVASPHPGGNYTYAAAAGGAGGLYGDGVPVEGSIDTEPSPTPTAGYESFPAPVDYGSQSQV